MNAHAFSQAISEPPQSRSASTLGLRELGRTGLVTSPLVLGCARLGSTLTPLSRQESLNLLHEALDLGIRHFDTASIYGQGDSERYLGAAFQSRRSEICIATKAGQRLSPWQAAAAKFKGPIRFLSRYRAGVRSTVARRRAEGVDTCFEPAYLLRSLEESLRRLKTDYVDLFYLHSPGTAALHDEELSRLAEQLRRDGKIRCFGVSCDQPAVALAAAQVPEVRVVQFDLDDSLSTSAILATADRNGKAALVRGVARRVAGEGGGEEELGRAFRAALNHPAVAGIIVGTTDIGHLRSNARAFKNVSSGLGLSPLPRGEG
jgi:aryl-alcohol dehydrogenase-like predicted oxidoreductase